MSGEAVNAHRRCILLELQRIFFFRLKLCISCIFKPNSLFSTLKVNKALTGEFGWCFGLFWVVEKKPAFHTQCIIHSSHLLQSLVEPRIAPYCCMKLKSEHSFTLFHYSIFCIFESCFSQKGLQSLGPIWATNGKKVKNNHYDLHLSALLHLTRTLFFTFKVHNIQTSLKCKFW